MNSSYPIIGLIGGIGSGKSTIASVLKTNGCVIADADENTSVVLKDSEVRDQLVQWWGKEILNIDGHVNRKEVSGIVFNDEDERKKLETLIHPRVMAMQEAQFLAAPSETIALVIDAPLLIESGLDSICDAVIFVDASKETRLQRVINNRGWSEDELEKREYSQLPLDMKRKKADYVVVNEGDLNEVHNQVKQILENIHNRRPAR
ncbi:MAG: dephospho-CoA kinase [Phycisphaerales bacterium]|jgi:dephospho-CoA kinase|nr:dephospho-CoA kinase [Phycisphaerales bacterium]